MGTLGQQGKVNGVEGPFVRGSPVWRYSWSPDDAPRPGRNEVGGLGGSRPLTGLYPQMWEETTVPIPAEALMGTDSDSGPEDLVYTLERPSNGRVVLSTASSTEIHSFTQAQLDSGLVLFSHRGGCGEVGVPRGWAPAWAGEAQLPSRPRSPGRRLPLQPV